jgi:hypothetical protein
VWPPGAREALAPSTSSVDVEDAASPEPDDAGAAEARVPLPSGSSADVPDGSTPDAEQDSGGGSGGGVCGTHVLINELMTRGPSASEEFVELYNPNTCAISLGGWKLEYRSQSGSGNTTLYTFAAGDSIPAKSFLVLGSASFGPKDKTFSTSGMADDGQVGLSDAQGGRVDAVAYGSTRSGPFREGDAAPKPPANGSIGRKSDGVDTDDNAADFKILTTPTPGAPNGSTAASASSYFPAPPMHFGETFASGLAAHSAGVRDVIARAWTPLLSSSARAP